MKPLLSFLKKHHVLCLATTGNGGGHATPLFYALKEDPLQLIFISDPHTRHMREGILDRRVSAGVYLESKNMRLILGVQLWGSLQIPRNSSQAAAIYFKAFPQAKTYCSLHPGHRFCILRVEKARLIKNRAGRIRKKEWNFEENPV